MNGDNKKKIILITSLILLVFAFVGIGITAAYFVPNITNQDSISVISVGGASITLTLTNGTTDKTITGVDIIPGWSDTKNFKVTVSNNSGKEISYDVNLIIIKNEFGSDMEYTLTGSGDSGYGSVASWTRINSNTSVSATTQKLASGSFSDSTAAHNYVLTVRCNETSSAQNYQGKTFTAYPSISTSDKVLYQVPIDKTNLWKSTDNGGLLDAIKTNTMIYTNTRTIPLNETATTDEGLIVLDDSTNELNSIDDTGKASYFFRGAVENNYVEFANKCWRIVRIDGDNNIKLVLYNDNTANIINPCSVTGESLAFIDNGSVLAFNNYDDSNAYVGFMYGTPDSSTFEAEHEHTIDSNALSTLKIWYNAYFVNATDVNSKKYQDYLADVVWCNDISTKSGGIGMYNDTGLGYEKNRTYYGFNIRTSLGFSPTYKCDNELSRYTSLDLGKNNASTDVIYKMGLLTADEVAFAGGKDFTINASYYLTKNANGNWWLLSPYYWAGSANEFAVKASGSINTAPVTYVQFQITLRPSVSLKSTATIVSGGTGTSSNPYVISGY